MTSLLRVEDLVVAYNLESGAKLRAIDNISFTLDRGEVLGLVGESGCGKSTLALTLMRLLPPEGTIERGKIWFDGIDLARVREEEMRKIRWRRISIVFQGSMNALNPLHKVGDQIAEAILLHKPNVSREEALKMAGDLLEHVGIPRERIKNYPFEFSGGMRQRVMIAMALALNPDLIIADEPTTALDVIVESQILSLLKRIKEEFGLSMIIISHDLSIVSELANKVAIMYAGKIVEMGSIRDVYKSPKHPYTKALLDAFPRVDEPRRRLYAIPGTPPNLINPPPGCRFHPRCPYAEPICREKEPEFYQVGDNHYSMCHLVKEGVIYE